MSKPDTQYFIHPRYWLTWLGVALIWLITRLPLRLQLMVGKGLGLLMFHLLGSRRRVCCINLELAFPDLSLQQRQILVKKHFVSVGQGLIETAFSWWGSAQKVEKIPHVFEGREYLSDALKNNKSVILLSAHFTSLELGGRLLSLAERDTIFHAVYRPHQNELIEVLVAKIRTQRYGKTIAKNNIRDMIRSLKKGFPVWYAQDQNYLGKNTVDVPFFGVDAATNPGTSRIVSMTGAIVIPFFTVRKNGGKGGYLLRLLPPLENFPSDDVKADTALINQVIESQVRESPEQYLWTHKRYKQAGHDFYGQYQNQHPETACK